MQQPSKSISRTCLVVAAGGRLLPHCGSAQERVQAGLKEGRQTRHRVADRTSTWQAAAPLSLSPWPEPRRAASRSPRADAAGRLGPSHPSRASRLAHSAYTERPGGSPRSAPSHCGMGRASARFSHPSATCSRATAFVANSLTRATERGRISSTEAVGPFSVKTSRARVHADENVVTVPSEQSTRTDLLQRFASTPQEALCGKSCATSSRPAA
jgi:hypothetical protein